MKAEATEPVIMGYFNLQDLTIFCWIAAALLVLFVIMRNLKGVVIMLFSVFLLFLARAYLKEKNKGVS